ncbi:carbonic anhydrase [Clostridium ganghwense]|uniref:Uncharacterized protein n=1 Tax=Clostridium ganghwense TaxID=312089 RepID=A0ABT4CRE9_9CLOT|nr:carbonic anhydrase [Clostridium ganghwense]MCY6371617.1 hypothetical protein [Clostridium ganghwense]
MKKKFAAAINCMDGRVQIPVIQYITKKYHVKYVDMITEAGPNKILAENKDSETVDSIKKRVEISIDKHDSDLVAIVGHYDCAGNPVDEEKQIEDIKLAIKTVEAWNLDVKIIGLYVNEKWSVKKIC